MPSAKQETNRLTTKQVMAGFKVSDMTIFTWRQGTPTKEPLPCHADGNRVFFKEPEMVKWAKKNGVAWDATAALKAPGPAKTGPKTERKPDPETIKAIRNAAQKALGKPAAKKTRKAVAVAV
jgi:hypothetical protein